MIRIGSLFAGIGGFELGLERAIPGSETIWQVEQEPFCQKVLKKHWPNATIYDDVRTVGSHNLESVDILCGGFPCQDISTAGKGKGLEGEKSGLWFEMLRIISELRPRVVILENVPIIITRGLSTVLGGLSEVGYDAEWNIISARQFGACHLRRRWFCVAYPNSERLQKQPNNTKPMETQSVFKCRDSKNERIHIRNYWEKKTTLSGIRRMDDGVSAKLDKHRLKSLGNAIVPQCSEYIGLHILNSGLLDDLS